MSAHLIRHVALNVESLRQAAHFYTRLFDLHVSREIDPTKDGEPEPGGVSAHPGAPEATASDGTCVLSRGDLCLVLTRGTTESGGTGRIAHICLEVDQGELSALGSRALLLGCHAAEGSPGPLVLVDVYGIVWHVVADRASDIEHGSALSSQHAEPS